MRTEHCVHLSGVHQDDDGASAVSADPGWLDGQDLEVVLGLVADFGFGHGLELLTVLELASDKQVDLVQGSGVLGSGVVARFASHRLEVGLRRLQLLRRHILKQK